MYENVHTGRYPLMAERCVRLAAKMIRVCSNAVQCRVTLARHRKLVLRLRSLVATYPAFYPQSGHGVAAKVLARFAPDGRVPGGDGAASNTAGEDVDVMALAGELEELVLSDEQVEASHGLCNEFEQTWLLSDAGPLSKAVKDAQKVSKSGIDDMEG